MRGPMARCREQRGNNLIYLNTLASAAYESTRLKRQPVAEAAGNCCGLRYCCGRCPSLGVLGRADAFAIERASPRSGEIEAVGSGDWRQRHWRGSLACCRNWPARGIEPAISLSAELRRREVLSPAAGGLIVSDGGSGGAIHSPIFSSRSDSTTPGHRRASESSAGRLINRGSAVGAGRSLPPASGLPETGTSVKPAAGRKARRASRGWKLVHHRRLPGCCQQGAGAGGSIAPRWGWQHLQETLPGADTGRPAPQRPGKKRPGSGRELGCDVGGVSP